MPRPFNQSVGSTGIGFRRGSCVWLILFGCLFFAEGIATAQSNATVRVAGIVLK